MSTEVEELNDTPEENVNPKFVRVDVALKFEDSGYIGLPYWKERNSLIDIGKEVNPRLGPAKKEAAIAATLEKMGITEEGYAKIQQRAARPFYTATDADDGSGEIIIPQRIFQSFLNHASMAVPKVIPRIQDKGLTFIGVKIFGGHFRTGKTVADAQLFSRFVKMAESNQRSFCESKFIIDFVATGILTVDESIIKVPDLLKLVEYAGRRIGIGSGRPQGFGRFTVNRWEAAG